MQEWISRVKALLTRRRGVEERTEELQFHLEMEMEAGLKMGLSPEEARRRARLRAGLLGEGVESAREALGIRWLDGLAGDLRHAFRALVRNRGYAGIAILVLSSSVAVNTLVYCILSGVVLRPLPYRAPEQLVRLFDAGRSDPKFPMSLGHYLDYRANAKSLESIALYTGRDVELSGMAAGESRQLSGMHITPDYFAVLGKPMARGRAFSDADMADRFAFRPQVRNAILSYQLWKTQFQADPAIVGKTIRLDREAWTVVGVASEGLQHPGGEYRSPLQGETVDVWLPQALGVEESPLRAWHFCNAIARIRPGFTAAQAQQELTQLAAAYKQRFPAYGDWSVGVESLLNEVTGRSRQLVWLLAAAAGLLMLVACANVAGLSMARGSARQGELALRVALGANRWQLARVGLAENVLLGAAGALVGLALVAIALPQLHTLLPADFPRAHEIELTWSAALFAIVIALANVVLAGLLPVWGGKSMESQRATSNVQARRLRTVLVASEVALAGLLCAGALFLLRSYQEVGARDHGFNAASVLTLRVTLQLNKPGSGARMYDEMFRKIREIPGVVSAGATTNLPWSGYSENTNFRIVGHVEDKGDEPGARFQAASPGYFEAAGMRLLKGRLFDWASDGVRQKPPTVVVNDELARRYFPNEDAVGAMLDLFGEKRQVVGVLMGIRDQPADLDVKPAFWFPLTQVEFPNVFFAIRTAAGVDPASVSSAVAAAVHTVDPELPVAEVQTLERRAAAAMAARRFALWLFQAFALLALVLAAAGIYGLLAYLVQQRRKELSIRLALGAGRGDLWRMVLRDGLRMAAFGGICCVVLIPVGGYLLRAFLFQVEAFDMFTIAGTPVALMMVAIVASLGPAWSAMRSDPVEALRGSE